jgi:Fe2+ transport system protein FeoA
LDEIPLKLEMGCLPGNLVELVQIAPLAIRYTLFSMIHVAIQNGNCTRN